MKKPPTLPGRSPSRPWLLIAGVLAFFCLMFCTGVIGTALFLPWENTSRPPLTS
jgi:hypothetical protein